MNNIIEIETDFIKLDSFLKLAGIVSTGGEGKIVIADGAVTVNDEICFMRGKKIYPDDTVSIDGDVYVCKKRKA